MINNKKIVVISGDPNSINSEIIYKSWKKLNKSLRNKLFIVANYELLKKQFKHLNYPIKLKKVIDLNESSYKNQLKIINIAVKFKDPFKLKINDASKYVMNCLFAGHKLALSKTVSGLINCPINKNLLNKKNYGVTEFLAKECKIKNKSEAMLIKNKKLSVSPITTHLDLKDVSKNIKSNLIIIKVKTIHNFFMRLLKKKPIIGILGLNPHNAELRSGSKEAVEIIPAIRKLKKLGFNIKGPLVADTTFIKDYKKYDVIVGMYHDQVLTPFKTIYKFDAINLTLGLNYLRASPDHGVALDLIKKNKANSLSLLNCIKFINKFG